MDRYIKNIKGGGNAFLNLNYNISSNAICCGDGYKNGTKHYVYSKEKKEIEVLIDVIRRFKFTRICRVTDNSFEFYSPNQKIQIFFFRVCRYIRNPTLFNVLKETVNINDLGVDITNSFLFAHYNQWVNCEVGPYDISPGRDPISGTGTLKLNYNGELYTRPLKGFNNLDSFKKKFKTKGPSMCYHQNLFLKDDILSKNVTQLRSLIVKKQFKEAEDFIKSINFVTM